MQRISPFQSLILLLPFVIAGFSARSARAVDEMYLDRLFGIPLAPVEDDIWNWSEMDPNLALDDAGMPVYRFRIEAWGVSARQYGRLQRELKQGSISVPVVDVLDPEQQFFGMMYSEIIIDRRYSLLFDYFTSRFEHTRDPLSGIGTSLRLQYKLVNGPDGSFALEAGYNYFYSKANFTNVFLPQGDRILSDAKTHNPMFGFEFRLRPSRLVTISAGYRANPSPIDWLDTNIQRANAKIEWIVMRNAVLVAGYELFDIRFQDPPVGESADITFHGPYMGMGMIF